MIIDMIAREVGEAAGRDTHAVEPVLVEAVRRASSARCVTPSPASASSVRCSSTGSGVVSEPYCSPFGDTTPTVPMLAAGRPSAAQICRVKAATEVLPLVPVTAAIVAGLAREELRRGQCQRAARIADRHEGDIGGQPVRPLLGGDRDRACAAACLAKCAPSAFAPAMAKNRKPGLTLRLSAVMPAMSMPASCASGAHRARRLAGGRRVSSVVFLVSSSRENKRNLRPHARETQLTGWRSPWPGSTGRPWADRNAARDRAAGRSARSPWPPSARRSSRRWRSHGFPPPAAARPA